MVQNHETVGFVVFGEVWREEGMEDDEWCSRIGVRMEGEELEK